MQEYGADLVTTGESYADALAASERWVLNSGALPIHAFDQEETILGQATLGMELEAQSTGLDTFLVAVGGGGLIAGIAASYAGRIKIVAVEPEASPTLLRALEAGEPVDEKWNLKSGKYSQTALSIENDRVTQREVFVLRGALSSTSIQPERAQLVALVTFNGLARAPVNGLLSP